MSRETIRMCPPHDDAIWEHVARHEAGHAVASTLASLDVFGNHFGVQRVHIRPGKTNVASGRNGKSTYCWGLCESVPVYGGVGADIAKAYVKHNLGAVPNRIRAAEWEIVACMAGPFADMLSQGFKSLDAMRWNAIYMRVGVSDFEQAEALFEDVRILAGRRAGMVKLMRRTRELVIDNWPAITSLADELMRVRYLEGEDVRKIIVPHLRQRHQALAA